MAHRFVVWANCNLTRRSIMVEAPISGVRTVFCRGLSNCAALAQL
jgi:hypothetical protein